MQALQTVMSEGIINIEMSLESFGSRNRQFDEAHLPLLLMDSLLDG